MATATDGTKEKAKFIDTLVIIPTLVWCIRLVHIWPQSISELCGIQLRNKQLQQKYLTSIAHLFNKWHRETAFQVICSRKNTV